MPLIVLADFPDYVDMPQNIPPVVIKRYALSARKYELEPVLDNADLLALVSGIIPDDKPQTLAFFADFVKPFWVFAAYCEFITRHGVAVTPAGMKLHLDNNSENLSDKRLGDLLTSDLKKKNRWATDVKNELLRLKRKLDDVEYPAASEKPAALDTSSKGNGFRIGAVGPDKPRYGYLDDDWKGGLY